MKIRRRKSKKRYLNGKNVYEYEQFSVAIPKRFHNVVEPFLDKDLDMNVKTAGKSKVVIVLKPRENVSANRNTPDKTRDFSEGFPHFLHKHVIDFHILVNRNVFAYRAFRQTETVSQGAFFLPLCVKT